MTTNPKTLILIDGHALAYRAYFGMPETFSTRQGEKTNAVYGFMNMILAIWKDFEPDYFIVTFDLGDTFRHKLYSDYKGTREKMPEDLAHQITRIEQLVRAFKMPVYTKDGYEADDLLGTLAYQAAAQGIEALIVTGDRDAFQLIGPHIKVIYPGRSLGGRTRFAERQVYDEAAVEKWYKLPPSKLVDLKALVGDSSDNIPGVKGIGEKGGANLLQKYDNLDNIYANLDKIAPGHRKKLEADRENAYLSQKLGRIITDVPEVELVLEEGKTKDFDLVEVANLFVELEFNTIFNRIPGAPADKSPLDIATRLPEGQIATEAQPPDGTYITIDSYSALNELCEKLAQSHQLCVDVETDSPDEVQTNLVGIAISATAGEGYYIPLRHGLKIKMDKQANLFEEETIDLMPEQLTLETVQTALAPLFASADITKVMHNAKFDMAVLERHGMPISDPIFDSMVASWLLNNAPDARHGLKHLALQELNIQMTPITELIGSGKAQITMDQVSIGRTTPYAAADVDLTLRLTEFIASTIQANDKLNHILTDLELPLIHVLKDMELAGILVDVDVLREISEQVGERLTGLIQDIHTLAGQTFNINSTQQLSYLLFEQLDLPTQGLKKTKSGHYSTAAGVLEQFAGQHPIVDRILEHRTLNKLQNTYLEALPKLINPHTGRIHTNYNQIGISTGRLSSMNPNLQNIPIRTTEGRGIRRAFTTDLGWKLIAADYSQVELRIMAHITDDEGLKTAFANDEDIHTATAAAVLGLDPETVNKNQRRIAKTVNFGLAYGQGGFGLSQSTGMSRDEAKQFIETYFEKYPRVKGYIDETKQLAAEQGYLETLLGRRRDFSALAELRGPQKARMEREAINLPIQGTAADIMKIAMIRLHQSLKQQHFQARILLQVHDELVLEAPDSEIDQLLPLIQTEMSQAFTLSVPLKVDIEVGQNWLEMAASFKAML